MMMSNKDNDHNNDNKKNSFQNYQMLHLFGLVKIRKWNNGKQTPPEKVDIKGPV